MKKRIVGSRQEMKRRGLFCAYFVVCMFYFLVKNKSGLFFHCQNALSNGLKIDYLKFTHKCTYTSCMDITNPLLYLYWFS